MSSSFLSACFLDIPIYMPSWPWTQDVNWTHPLFPESTLSRFPGWADGTGMHLADPRSHFRPLHISPKDDSSFVFYSSSLTVLILIAFSSSTDLDLLPELFVQKLFLIFLAKLDVSSLVSFKSFKWLPTLLNKSFTTTWEGTHDLYPAQLSTLLTSLPLYWLVWLSWSLNSMVSGPPLLSRNLLAPAYQPSDLREAFSNLDYSQYPVLLLSQFVTTYLFTSVSSTRLYTPEGSFCVFFVHNWICSTDVYTAQWGSTFIFVQ